MRLFIAEKPSVAKAISESLGIVKRDKGFITCKNGDLVTWCVGHVLEQAEPDAYTSDDIPKTKSGKKLWREEDLPIIPEKWLLEVKKETKDQVKVIQSLLKQASVVINAGDPDREGQLLIDEVLDYFHFKGETLRYWASAQDEASVQKALSALKPNKAFEKFGLAARARSKADWLYGMNLSRAYTLASKRTGAPVLLSVGRVQSAVLNLIVTRDKQIKNFRPKNYFRIIAEINHKNGSFIASWKPTEEQNGLDEENRLLDEKIADALLAKIQNKTGEITSFEEKAGKLEPPLCLDLGSLQIKANAKYGFSSEEVLNICQSLYEIHKLTSYPRSDCGYLPEDQFKEAPEVLSSLSKNYPALSSLIAKANTALKSKVWNDKKITAHHGIIPTKKIGDLSQLSDKEIKIYDLICRTYLAQFFSAQTFQNTKIDISISEEKFTAQGKTITSKGWTEILSTEKEENSKEGEEDKEQTLPKVAQNDPILCQKSEKKSLQTKPPRPFTEGTVISAMINVHKFIDDPKQQKILKDGEGIGTPATRASILSELKKKEYIEEKGKNLLSTKLGQELIDCLNPKIKSPVMTAVFERFLKQIEDGSMTEEAFITLSSKEVTLEVARLKDPKINLHITAPSPKITGKISSKYKCPKCRSPLSRRASKNKKGTYWWGCTNYPTCKETFFDEKGKPVAPKKKA
ncbi:DNA topoisomerase III [Acetobacteraceae bacterium]|nr:DNA topoisomerase III [Acetobacteraceae bacterium]